MSLRDAPPDPRRDQRAFIAWAIWDRSQAKALPAEVGDLVVRASDPTGLATVAVDHTGIITDFAFTERARTQTTTQFHRCSPSPAACSASTAPPSPSAAEDTQLIDERGPDRFGAWEGAWTEVADSRAALDQA